MRVIYFIIILFICNHSKSQPWVEGMFDQSKNFYQTQSEFNSYWENKTIEKGKGWKQFKRWENFMSPRVDANGLITCNIWKEWQKSLNLSSSNNANWMALGPTDVPLLSSGQRRGVGRVNVVDFHPTNPDIMFIGAPAGGLWKTIDGGLNWVPLTDHLPNLGVSDIAIDPTNPNVMFLATGDKDGGDTYAYGIIKSLDGGLSWDTAGNLSFDITYGYRGNRILINPNNTDIIIASVRKAGNGEVYKSVDGGTSWNLMTNNRFISMEFKPDNPNVIYAGTRTNGEVWRSIDMGNTWTQMTNGLPSALTDARRVQIAVTPNNPNVVYALMCNSDNGFFGIYKSSDAGTSWSQQSNSPNLLGWQSDGSDSGGQGWYDLSLGVSPNDENTVFVGGVNIWKSTNGGVSWTINGHWTGSGGAEYVHADEHIIRYNTNTGVLFSGNDGGLYKSTNNGNNWEDISDGLQISQFYRIGVSQTDPYLVIAGAQDNGTELMTSNNSWDAVRGGDGMECIIDYTNPSIMYSSVYYGAISRSTNGGYGWSDISPNNDGAWVTPYVMDKNNSNILYAGYTELYKTNDSGDNWNQLTNGETGGGTINALAVSESNPDYIYFSDGANLFASNDAGSSWSNVTVGTGLFQEITYIAIHPNNPAKLWITYSGYSGNSTSANKVYQSDDAGNSWNNISGSLPNIPVNCIIFHQSSLEELYIGTDLGVYYRDASMNDWQSFNNGLPNVIVNELEIQVQTNKLRASTFGRGLWETNLPITAPPVANFYTNDTSFCSVPADVSFVNTSINATNFIWDFGDNTTSNDPNPIHTYNNFGDYSVNLISTGPLGSDSILQTFLISVQPSNPCLFNMPVNGTGNVINNCNGVLYDGGGPSGNYFSNSDSYITISPPNANQINLNFVSFGVESPTIGSNTCNWDYLEIFDGPDNTYPSLGQFCNTLTGSPGNITTSTGSVTLHLHSDQSVEELGFEMIWSCVYPNSAPQSDFSFSNMGNCDGSVSFIDLSTNNPSNWNWDFGDGSNNSNIQYPIHTYNNSGTYNVTLTTTNSFGSNTYSYPINISVISPPTVVSDTGCENTSLNLTANPSNNGSLYWYDSPAGGNVINTGTNYQTPLLTSSNTYYVSENALNSTMNGGPANENTLGAGGWHYNDAHYLIFNCSEPTQLSSVDVYAETGFTINIELRDSQNNVLQSTNTNLTQGLNTVNLNFSVPIGTDLQLGISGTNDGLYRNNNLNNAFPMNVGNNIEITRSSAGSNAYQYYYYFYNWEVQEFCSSARIPVEAIIIPTAAISINPNQNINICSGDSVELVATNGFNNYLWNTQETTQSIFVNAAGNYTVTGFNTPACNSDYSVQVNIISSSININNIGPACIGDTILLQADNGYLNYEWNTGDTTRTIEIYSDGLYNVEAYDINGCFVSQDININFNNPTPVSIVSNPTPPVICLGEEITLEGSSGFQNYTWKSPSTVSSGFSPILNYSPSNSETVILEAIDVNGCTSFDTIIITVDSCQTNTMNLMSSKIKIYPNPTERILFIEQKSSNKEKINKIEILNLEGKVIITRKKEILSSYYKEQFDFKNQPKGVYIMKIYTELGVFSKRVIIK